MTYLITYVAFRFHQFRSDLLLFDLLRGDNFCFERRQILRYRCSCQLNILQEKTMKESVVISQRKIILRCRSGLNYTDIISAQFQCEPGGIILTHICHLLINQFTPKTKHNNDRVARRCTQNLNEYSKAFQYTCTSYMYIAIGISPTGTVYFLFVMTSAGSCLIVGRYMSTLVGPMERPYSLGYPCLSWPSVLSVGAENALLAFRL